MNNSKSNPQDTRKVFWKKGTCSQTLFYLLNREFGHLKENEERAVDPLAGGLAATGHQCGMLWGAAMAVGAESFRRCDDCSQAIGSSITATQHLMKSFSKRTNTVNCREITHCDLTTKKGMLKLMVKTILTGFLYSPCFNLANKWVPEAIETAKAALSKEHDSQVQQPSSCASEVARKMGASDEEIVMVSGFAGGLGLSGNACGALGAAIWMKNLIWCKENPGQSSYSNPVSKKILAAFYNETGSKILCREICGKKFTTLGEHTEFVKSGGCEKLIETLSKL